MPLPFDAENQRKIIELAYLGEWMINAHHAPEHQDEAARAALQQLLAAAKLPGKKAIGRDVETGEYYLEEGWTDELYGRHVSEYDDHIFWDELTERLAQRDVARRRQMPTDEVNRDDHLAELKPLEDFYRHELEEHGIDRLELTDDE